MDERTKRLLKVLVFSLIVIALAKMGLTRTYDALSKAAAEKKQAASVRPSSPQPAPPAAEIIDAPAASAVGETTAAGLLATSGVDEKR